MLLICGHLHDLRTNRRLSDRHRSGHLQMNRLSDCYHLRTNCLRNGCPMTGH